MTPADALVRMSFGYGDQFETFESSIDEMMERGGAIVTHKGISRSGAADILHRLRFMGFDVVRRKRRKPQEPA